jgi:hypothetical protein
MNIEILLHCHTSPTPLLRGDGELMDAETMQEFVDAGLIELTPSRGQNVYGTTPLGGAWVEALCMMPPPKQIWTTHDGTPITNSFHSSSW